MLSPRPSISVCLVLILFANTASAVQRRQPAAASDDGADLAAVINTVRDALAEAQQNNVPGFPKLKSVTLKMQTVAVKGGGGAVKFLVFSLGTKIEAEATSSLTLAMNPPPTDEPISPAALDPTKLRHAIASALLLAKQAILAGNAAEPRLILNKTALELKFAVRKEVSGGVTVTELLPVGLEGSGKIARTKIHTLELVFSNE